MKIKQTCKPRTSRPWIWFVLAVVWSLQAFQDVQAGKTYIYDLVAAIVAVGMGAYLRRQNRAVR